ncbi:MAG TPA: hypothetical protein VNG33_09315 [Polyangiaceae bacterium]|nr:hypothetical protein [Polyangiaceae bacterium]
MSLVALGACSKTATKVQPDTRGKRGETCLARNDCDTGLACLNGICAQNEFNIEVAAKQCTRVECAVDDDCCGGRATSAPAKCKGRDSICTQPQLTGCQQTSCVSDATCMGGAPCLGTCVGQGQTAGTTCTVTADCTPAPNTCNIVGANTFGSCTATGQFCDDITPCSTLTVNCSSKTCKCQNPDYDPTADICTDPDCEDICLLRCQDSLCVQDKSCKTDAECLAVGSQICDGGRCVECLTKKDCDVKNDETCENGVCHKPCAQNEECPLFDECQSGDCVYVGCQSDRECILAASRGQQIVGSGGTSGTQNAAPTGSNGDDPRLYKCLPSTDGSKTNTCKIPCENDGSCGQFQVCSAGYCKFIGCKTDEECRAYLGISNQMTSDIKPYVATAKCEAPPTDAASTP